mgnify:CR=1 FL=1
MEIASIKTMFYVVKMEQSKLTIRVPLEKQEEVGLRKISSKKIIALGGISIKNIKLLSLTKSTGFAGISIFKQKKGSY